MDAPTASEPCVSVGRAGDSTSAGAGSGCCRGRGLESELEGACAREPLAPQTAAFFGFESSVWEMDPRRQQWSTDDAPGQRSHHCPGYSYTLSFCQSEMSRRRRVAADPNRLTRFFDQPQRSPLDQAREATMVCPISAQCSPNHPFTCPRQSRHARSALAASGVLVAQGAPFAKFDEHNKRAVGSLDPSDRGVLPREPQQRPRTCIARSARRSWARAGVDFLTHATSRYHAWQNGGRGRR